MKINSAEFIISNSDVSKCPQERLPEYAFIGRSNVGKSSLINMLTNHKNLAKTSGKPGKTQLINHFKINLNWFLVDLPGYGLSERLPRAYTVADMCNAIKLVAQWVSQRHPGQPLQVVGVSLSCEFLARVAQQSPGLFNTLALVSPTGFRGGRCRPPRLESG
jgi:hypothetical protein